MKILGVPRTRHGPDTAALEAILLAHKPKFLFTNSMYHNPTGTSLSPSVAHRVLQLAEQHDFHIVEDDIYADFQNGPSTRLATLDSLRRVIYLASFSKTLSCSLRVGYLIAGPELIRRLADVKMYTSIGSQRFAECVVSTMLANGSYRKLVQRLRQRLTRQMAATCGCLGTTAGRCSPNRSAGCSSGPYRRLPVRRIAGRGDTPGRAAVAGQRLQPGRRGERLAAYQHRLCQRPAGPGVLRGVRVRRALALPCLTGSRAGSPSRPGPSRA